jgi:hypothetical protein
MAEARGQEENRKRAESVGEKEQVDQQAKRKQKVSRRHAESMEKASRKQLESK